MDGNLKVYVVFRSTPEGRRAARFAASVAGVRGELHVLLPSEPVDCGESERLLGKVAEFAQARTDSFGWHGRDRADFLHAGNPETFDFGDAVVVDGPLASVRRDASVIAPQFETALFGRGAGPALVPFGDRESALRAMELGLPILRGCGFGEIVFYHTTWRADGVASENPEDHMNDAAREVLTNLRNLADLASVRHRTIVETADSIPAGIQRAALRNGCRLVVTARDPERFGHTYVDEMIEDAPTPVLVVGNKKEVKR